MFTEDFCSRPGVDTHFYLQKQIIKDLEEDLQCPRDDIKRLRDRDALLNRAFDFCVNGMVLMPKGTEEPVDRFQAEVEVARNVFAVIDFVGKFRQLRRSTPHIDSDVDAPVSARSKRGEKDARTSCGDPRTQTDNRIVSGDGLLAVEPRGIRSRDGTAQATETDRSETILKIVEAQAGTQETVNSTPLSRDFTPTIRVKGSKQRSRRPPTADHAQIQRYTYTQKIPTAHAHKQGFNSPHQHNTGYAGYGVSGGFPHNTGYPHSPGGGTHTAGGLAQTTSASTKRVPSNLTLRAREGAAIRFDQESSSSGGGWTSDSESADGLSHDDDEITNESKVPREDPMQRGISFAWSTAQSSAQSTRFYKFRPTTPTSAGDAPSANMNVHSRPFSSSSGVSGWGPSTLATAHLDDVRYFLTSDTNTLFNN